jgi:hypothetical protein
LLLAATFVIIQGLKGDWSVKNRMWKERIS